MQPRQRVSAVGMLLALAACQPTPATDTAAGGGATEDLAAVRSTIEATEKQWSQVYLAGDATGIANLYSEDAASIGASEWHRGRAAIAADMQAHFDTVTIRTREDVTEEVILLGDHAFEVGYYTWTGVSKRDSSAVSGKGRYTVLWRKDADGTWRLFRDLGSEAPPAAN